MSKVRTVIELTHGKKVLVQGIIGQMAAYHEWYYVLKRDQIFRNIRLENGKKSKQSLLRFLLSLHPSDGIRARRIDKEPILYQGMICENYLTNNLATNRKVPVFLGRMPGQWCGIGV